MQHDNKRLSRDRVYTLQPAIPKGLLELGKGAAGSLDPSLIHLVNVRVSQINGCAFCLRMHNDEARRDGEQQSRLDVLSAWREASEFSARERSALGWAEVLTDIAHKPVSDQVYREVSGNFTDVELVSLTAVILQINSWNRMAIGFRF
ncbi:carboxymuconolactone decarboxylase family protein [Marinobacter lipolyticus]|nr:carboxymuconolactone decarboxylase family protein [Marinobacter lipolyticus]